LHVAEADENSDNWLAEMHASLKELNQAQERYQTKLWEYALMAAYLDLMESAYSVAANSPTFGPFAFLLEAAWRVGEAATGQFDLPEDEVSSLITKEPLHQGVYVKGAQKAALRAYVDKWIEQVIAGSDAKGLLWDDGFWAVLRSEVLLDGKVEAHIVHRAFVRHKPREYMDAFRRHLKDPDFWKGLAKDILISSAREYLFEEAAREERLAALAELATAQSAHNLALSMARSSINAYIFDLDALEVMQELLTERIREKDQAQDRRDLEHRKNEILKGEGPVALRLEFSGPVAVQGVILGGKAVSGGPSGDKSWEGKFTLENLPDTATLEVKAADPLTGKELDNPDSVARYAPTKEAWIGYEAGPDRHHLIQLGLGPPYLKSVRFESNGEVYYKATWVEHEGAEERVLEREIDKIVDIEEIKKGEIGLTFSKPMEKVLLLVGEREFNVSPAEGNRVFRGTVVLAGLEPKGEIPIEVAARDALDNTIDGNPGTIARPPDGGYEKERDRSHRIKTGESLTGGRFLVDSVFRIADAKEINPHLTHFAVVGEKRLDWVMSFKIDPDYMPGDPVVSEEWAGEEGARVPEFDSSRLFSGVDDKSFRDAEVSTAVYDMRWDSNTATKAGILQGHEPFHFTAIVRIYFTTLYRQSGLKRFKGFDDFYDVTGLGPFIFMKGRKLTAEELAARNVPFKVAIINDTKDQGHKFLTFKFHGLHVKYYLMVDVLGYGSDGTRSFPESAGELCWKLVDKISSNIKNIEFIDEPESKEEATGGINQPSAEGVMKQPGPSAALPDIPPQEMQLPSEISGGSLKSSPSPSNWHSEWNETTK
ncbi:MAG TPA: hypothetical protein ACFYD2_09635, partial [Candidatus Avalokitesvara rifleensis]|uniref:hypothetical protein n=1 Tax=Candidatus Avalokitesvara rifleensis TaxID=3367620 RepID=UPI004029BB40